jgi:hypothetical protein
MSAELLVAVPVAAGFMAALVDVWTVISPGVVPMSLAIAAFAVFLVPLACGAHLVVRFFRGGSPSLTRSGPAVWFLATCGGGATLIGVFSSLLTAALPLRYTNYLALDAATIAENPFGARIAVGHFIGGAQFLLYTVPLAVVLIHLHVERLRGMRSNPSLERP